jgi:hypothetical protein
MMADSKYPSPGIDPAKLAMILTEGSKILICSDDFMPKPGLESIFVHGELVTVKHLTFKVVYLNEKAVTLEQVLPHTIKLGEEDGG